MILPSGWIKVPLGDICRVVEGQVDPRDPEYRDLPHINGEVIESGSGRLLDLRTAAEDRLISGKYLFEPGMVLYSKLRPYLRKVTIAPSRGVCSADMYPLMFDPLKVDTRFAMLSMLAEPFTRYAVAESRRARMPKLNRAQLLAWKMPLPESVIAQRHIADKLAEQLAVADTAKRAAAERLVAAHHLVDAHLREAFCSERTSLWPSVKLGELTATCSGSTPSRGTREYFGGAVPWVKTGELKDGVIEATEETVTEVALERCALPRLPVGTLLVAMYGQGQTRGRTGLLACEATTNQACFAILPRPSVFSSEYLQLWFRANYGRLRAMTEYRGGNQPNLNGVLLRQLEVPLPPVPMQRQIGDELAGRLAASQSLIAAARAEFNVVAAIAPALLRTVFK